jgi:hypothetical protein
MADPAEVVAAIERHTVHPAHHEQEIAIHPSHEEGQGRRITANDQEYRWKRVLALTVLVAALTPIRLNVAMAQITGAIEG